MPHVFDPWMLLVYIVLEIQFDYFVADDGDYDDNDNDEGTLIVGLGKGLNR